MLVAATGLALAAWAGLVPGVQLRDREALPVADTSRDVPTAAAADASDPMASADGVASVDSAGADTTVTLALGDSTPVAAADSAAGEAVYRGAGRCAGCHGDFGAGVAGLGPSLRDDQWLYGGSRAAIRRVIAEGAAPPRGGFQVAMPAYGGQLAPEQVTRLAAYVWTLAHPGEVAADSGSGRPTVPYP